MKCALYIVLVNIYKQEDSDCYIAENKYFGNYADAMELFNKTKEQYTEQGTWVNRAITNFPQDCKVIDEKDAYAFADMNNGDAISIAIETLTDGDKQ